MTDFLCGIVRVVAAVVIERLDQRRACRHLLFAELVIGKANQVVRAIDQALRHQMRRVSGQP